MSYSRTTVTARRTATTELHMFVRDAHVDIVRHPQIGVALTYAPRRRMAQEAVDSYNLPEDARAAVDELVAAAVDAALAVGWHLARNPESLLFEDKRQVFTPQIE